MEQITGTRESSIYYIHKNYCYILNRENGGKKYYSCYRKKTCRGRAIVWNDSPPCISKNHTHEPDADAVINRIKFRKSLNHRAKTEKTPLNVIFNEEIERLKNNKIQNCNFKRIKRTMYRKRHGETPAVPQNLVELGTMMHDNNWKRKYGNIFAEVITAVDGNSAAIFYLEAVKKTAASGKEFDLHLDGSFRILIRRPKTAYNFFIAFASHSGAVFPLMFALMESESFELYQSVISYLKSTLVPEIFVRYIMLESVNPILEACKDVFPESKLFCCWYSYSLSLYSVAKEMKLFSKRKHIMYRTIIKKLMGLPLLPKELIADAINHLAEEAVGFEELNPLFSYVEEEWLPNNISVQGMGARSLDAFDSYRRDFSCIFQKSNPNVWFLIDRLSKICSLYNVIAEMGTPCRKTWNVDSNTSIKLRIAQENLKETKDFGRFFEYVTEITTDHLALFENPPAPLAPSSFPIPWSTKYSSDSEEHTDDTDTPNKKVKIETLSSLADIQLLPTITEPPPLILINKNKKCISVPKATTITKTNPPPLVPIVSKSSNKNLEVEFSYLSTDNSLSEDSSMLNMKRETTSASIETESEDKDTSDTPSFVIKTENLLNSKVPKLSSSSGNEFVLTPSRSLLSSSPPPLVYFASKKDLN